MQAKALEENSDPLSMLAAPADPAAVTAPPPPPYAPPPPADPVVTFLGKPAPKAPHTESSVPQNEEGVRLLAGCGAWRAAASLSERLLSQSHPVDKLLRLRWSYIVALLKLREVARAEREMTLLGDLRSAGWQYERYPGIYPGQTGSMVPFALLVLHALLPAYSGKHDHALARLYALLATESEAAAAPSAAPATPAEPGDASALGGSLARRSQVVLAIVNVLCALNDYPNAVAHLEQLLGAVEQQAVADSAKERAQLLSLLGRLHLQLGNLAAADDAFTRLEAVLGSSAADGSVPVRINRGMLAMARSQYAPALIEFEAARKLEAANAVAANNAAVCQLYCCRLNDAVATLEAQIKADPRGAMHEVIVSNLSALYQMREGGGNFKGTLERLVIAAATDDFDMGVLKLE